MELLDNNDVNELVRAIVALGNEEEAKLFLRDLLTSQEIEEMSKRWKVARMLDSGVSYAQIEKQTGLSSTTIARISKWLQSGTGGYRIMLDRFANSPAKRTAIIGQVEVSAEPDIPQNRATA